MLKRNKITNIYIDASSFAQPKKSGIGYVAEGIAVSMASEIASKKQTKFKIHLVVSLGKAKYVERYRSDIIDIKTIPLPYRVLQLLNRLNALPPMDVFLGRGVYIFPNYRNWRLAMSTSLTYIHDLTYLRFPEFTEPKNLAYLKSHVASWAHRADVILTASEYTKKEIAKYLSIEPRKIRVIHHGVDTDALFTRRSSVEIKKILKKYDIKAKNFILHVGNIEPRKNIKGLIQAYDSLQVPDRNKLPLVLVGGGGWSNEAEKSSINNSIKKGSNIIQPNRYVDDKDLPALYTAASVLVMPSFYEGFGLPPLQAIACGTPVVVAGNSSLKEIFKEVAIFVNPEETESIRKGIEQAISMDNKQLLSYREGAKKLASEYSWDRTAVKIFEIIGDIRA